MMTKPAYKEGVRSAIIQAIEVAKISLKNYLTLHRSSPHIKSIAGIIGIHLGLLEETERYFKETSNVGSLVDAGKHNVFISYARSALLLAMAEAQRERLKGQASFYDKVLNALRSSPTTFEGLQEVSMFDPLAEYREEVEGIETRSKRRIFISHASENKKEVEAIAREFEAKYLGFSCFVAHSSLRRGKQWTAEIFSELNNASFFVAIITPQFNGSAYCQQEVGAAIQKGIPIYPMISGAEMEGFIDDYQGDSADLDKVETIVGLIWKFVCDNQD